MENNEANQPPQNPQMPELSAFQNQKLHDYFEQLNNPDYSRLWESCLGKTVVGAVMGGTLGVGMGFIMGSFDALQPPPTETAGGRPLPPVTASEEMKRTFRQTYRKSKSWGKNFIGITAVFSGTECVIEKIRAKHDGYNSIMAGCATGAALASRSGPDAMVLGCAGFAAFSAAIDYFMAPDDSDD